MLSHGLAQRCRAQRWHCSADPCVAAAQQGTAKLGGGDGLAESGTAWTRGGIATSGEALLCKGKAEQCLAMATLGYARAMTA